MNGNPLVIGIDIGTSGVRAVAVDTMLSVHGSGIAKFTDFSVNHRDPAIWRQAMNAAISEVLPYIAGYKIAAVAFDGTSGTVLPVDAAGNPLAQPMMYNDPVTDQSIIDIIAEHGSRETAAHGATSGLAKAISFQTISNVAGIIHQADWLAGLLSGRFDLSDENNALKTGYDPVARCWPDWIGRTGARPGLLPRVLPAGTPAGSVTKSAANEFGLPEGAVVVTGTTDGCASFLATGADQPGDGVSALGTTLTVKILSAKPVCAPEYGLYSHRISDRWLAGGASNTGGGVLAQFFSGSDITALSERIDPDSETGLDYYPLLKPGERFPINDPQFSPRMTPRPRDDADFLKAIFEGIANIEALGYQRLAELGAPPLRSLRSVGGGAANSVWKEIRRRRHAVPFETVLSEQAAMGAARLALAGAKEAGAV